MKRMSAFLKKSLVDVTRRKGCILLVMCEILIGVLSLIAVNSASKTVDNAIAYIRALSEGPDLTYFTPQAVPSSVITEIKNNSKPLRMVGLARVAGSPENQGGVALTRGYMRANDLFLLGGAFASPGPFDKTRPHLETVILLNTRQSSNREQTAIEVEQVLQTAHINLGQAFISVPHTTDQQTVLIIIRDLFLMVMFLTWFLIINTSVITLNSQSL